MGVIKSSMEGKIYNVWQLKMNYLLYAVKEKLVEEYDPGFRISIIISCWMAIESFLRDCVCEYIMRYYHDIDVPEEFQYKASCSDKMKLAGISEQKIAEFKAITELGLKEKFANKARNSEWSTLLDICDQLDKPIEKHKPEWEFLKNLNNLRNGFAHGLSLSILQSNVTHLDDEISEKYKGAIRYLDKEKVVSLQKLISSQNISELLNSNTTKFFFDKTVEVFDYISDVFSSSYSAVRWQRMRQK